ncbi:hypothetical protein AVAK2825_16500 [Acidovorax sp. SUPP2825]|nr:hypothetical protein AVAK2825_16500 [Acidovorax sp. SUPP2825]
MTTTTGNVSDLPSNDTFTNRGSLKLSKRTKGLKRTNAPRCGGIKGLGQRAQSHTSTAQIIMYSQQINE